MSTEQNNLVRDVSYSEDEISLYDLYRVLSKRIKLIISVIVATLVICGIYLLVTPKTYQVTAILLPPANSDLYLTNINVSDDMKFKSDHIFKMYTQEIVSNENWNQFVRKEIKLFSSIASNDHLGNPFKLDKDKNFPGEHAAVQFETTDQSGSAEIVRKYLLFAKQKLIDVLTQQITSYLSHKTRALALEIQFERQAAKQARLDDIAQLENDLAIAKKLGIEENLFFNLAGKASDNKTGVFNVFTGNTSIPTYLRGSKVLSAELDSLKHRESDDAYIPSLRKKQDELQRLQSVKFTPETFQPYRLNGDIDKPKSPIRPKKLLVLVLGGVLGIFLGIFAAFIAEFLSRVREQDLA